MKFKTNMFLEVCSQRITGREFTKNIIANKLGSISEELDYYKNFGSMKNFKIDIKNKNLYVLVEGETVYIKLLTLPTVKKYLINDLIKNELRYYYKNIDHIAFTYKIIKKDKINMEILVFCLKGNKLDILQNSIDNKVNLKKVNLIQFSFKNYYSKQIHEKNYILIFYYNCNLYFLICYNDEIVANTIIYTDDFKLSCFSSQMNEFLEKYNAFAKASKKIYYANVEGFNIPQFNYLGLPYEVLGSLKKDDFLEYIIIKG
jgi:hypothetical protein